jgi:hypothetical protein
MFGFSPRKLRRKRTDPQRGSPPPHCERLEDRLAPSVSNGEVLVANYHSTFDVNSNNPNLTPGIYGVVLNDTNGSNTQSQVAVDGQSGVGNTFVTPTDLREDPTHASVLYVTDPAAGSYGTGAVIRVNLGASPGATIMNQSQSLVGPSALQWVTDSSGHTNLWVAYLGNEQSDLNKGYLVEMDLNGNMDSFLSHFKEVRSPAPRSYDVAPRGPRP